MASGIAALIELMSVGKQNKVLNANPQITFWRFTHMRYTDFSLEQVKVDGNISTSGLSAGAQTIHFDLPRSAATSSTTPLWCSTCQTPPW